MRKWIRRGKRGMAVILSACMIAGITPVSAKAEKIEPACMSEENAGSDPTQSEHAMAKNIELNATALRPESTWSSGDNLVYFGKYKDAPMAYRVLPTTDTQTTSEECLLLDCDISLENMDFFTDRESSDQWASESCTVRKWLNGNDFYENSSVFSTLEKTAIAQTTLAEKETYEPTNALLDAKDCLAVNPVFCLSVAEIDTLYKWGSSGKNEIYWLRSMLDWGRGSYRWIPLGINSSGNFALIASTNGSGVSPAFNVNVSLILFASESKTDKTGALLPTHTGADTQWKLTLLDDSKEVKVTDGCNVTRMDDTKESTTIYVPYTYTDNNATNPVSQLSVMITDKPYTDDNAQILYYGALEDTTMEEEGASGKGTFTLPAELSEKTCGTEYYAYMIAEDVNGEKETDYASKPAPIQIPDTVTDIVAPSKQSGTLTSNMAKISFTGKSTGTYYYMLKKAEEKAPQSLEDFASETDGSWTAKEGVYTGTLTKDANNSIQFTELTAGTDYILYLATQDTIAKIAAFSTLKVLKVAVSPTIIGTYGQKLSEMEISEDAKVVEEANADIVLSGIWQLAQTEEEEKIPSVGTTETVQYTFIPTGEDADRYEDVTCEAELEIAKAEAPEISGEEKNYIYTVGSEGKADSENIAAKLPADRETTTYTLTVKDNETLLSEVKVDKNGNLTYKVNATEYSKVDKTAVITVTAVMQNYEDAIYTHTIRIKDKKKVVLQSGSKVSVTSEDTLTYGEKLSKLTFGNAVFVEVGTENVVEGTLIWSKPDEAPNVGTTQAEWVFKPAQSDQYAELTGSVSIKVSTPPSQPSATPVAPPSASPAVKSTTSPAVSTVTPSATPIAQSTEAPSTTSTIKPSAGAKTKDSTGTTYKVTSIADKAFKNRKKVTCIIIGKDVTKIGKNAFAGCKNLKKIIIKTKKLTKKSVAKGAFRGVGKKVVVKVPKSKFRAYKKLLRSRGLSKKIKIKC